MFYQCSRGIRVETVKKVILPRPILNSHLAETKCSKKLIWHTVDNENVAYERGMGFSVDLGLN